MTDKSLSTIEQTLVEVIQKSVSAVEKGALWAQSELPQIAEQYLTYKLISSSIFFLLCFGYVIFYLILGYKICTNRDGKYSEMFWEMFLIFGGIAAIPCLLFGIDNLIEIIKIVAAPKVYLLEWAARVIK